MASVLRLESVSGPKSNSPAPQSSSVPVMAIVAAESVTLSAPDGPVTDAPVAMTVTVPSVIVACAVKASCSALKACGRECDRGVGKERQGSRSRDCHSAKRDGGAGVDAGCAGGRERERAKCDIKGTGVDLLQESGDLPAPGRRQRSDCAAVDVATRLRLTCGDSVPFQRERAGDGGERDVKCACARIW